VVLPSVYHFDKKMRLQDVGSKTKDESQKTGTSSGGVTDMGERHVVGAMKVSLPKLGYLLHPL